MPDNERGRPTGSCCCRCPGPGTATTHRDKAVEVELNVGAAAMSFSPLKIMAPAPAPIFSPASAISPPRSISASSASNGADTSLAGVLSPTVFAAVRLTVSQVRPRSAQVRHQQLRHARRVGGRRPQHPARHRPADRVVGPNPSVRQDVLLGVVSIGVGCVGCEVRSWLTPTALASAPVGRYGWTCRLARGWHAADCARDRNAAAQDAADFFDDERTQRLVFAAVAACAHPCCVPMSNGSSASGGRGVHCPVARHIRRCRCRSAASACQSPAVNCSIWSQRPKGSTHQGNGPPLA